MDELIQKDDLFRFHIPAEIKKGEDGKMWISGIASTEDEDLQGEKIKQDGLELSYFLKRGFLNDDHAKETGAKVGIPTEAIITKKGLWIKGYLLETARAKSIFELATALEKAGGDRKLGFSVEGKVMSRDSNNPRIITKAWIKDVAVTASPINPNTFLELAKSFANADCTQVLVDAEDETEAVAKSTAKKKKETETDVVDALESVTKQPVTEQSEVEKKDADKTAEQALSEKKPKQDMEKQINDVPIAKKKSEGAGDLEKGFAKVHELGGEREFGDKRIPVHVTTYRHKKSGHHIMVTSKDGAHAVTHMHKDLDKKCGDTEIIGAHLFHDDPDKGRKGDEELDRHLQGFGIAHKFGNKHSFKKAIVNANDDSNNCEICKGNIEQGELFLVADGHSFCGEDCVEKALVSGYQFAVTDQTGGAAMRVESLEGTQRDTGFAHTETMTKLKTVKFDTARANGGTVSVTLKDAIQFLMDRGISEDNADRILVLMIKNDGDLSKLAQNTKK